jgi:iron complex transport system permease protein
MVAVVAGSTLGPAGLGVGPVLGEMASTLLFLDGVSGLTETEQAILWQIRVPRVVLGGLVGAMLSVAGASYQGVFRNPLADPYLLGVAAGAGLGATLAIAYLPDSGAGYLPVAAFAGAVAAVGITYAIGRSVGGRSSITLILAGIAVAAFFTAMQTYVQQRNSETIRQVYTWILGRLSTSGWSEVRTLLPYVAISSIVLLLSRRMLDVMSVGDDEAESLGISSSRVRGVVVIFATLGTAAAVSVSGLIAFVGVVVPHAVRLMVGASHRSVIPLSMVLGAAFLILTDLAARTVASPAELPIGVITAFLGAPFFALVLRTSRRSI